MTLVTMRRRRRIIGVSPDNLGWVLNGRTVYRCNVRPSAIPEMSFSYQKMSVLYHEQHFSYHNPSR